MPETVTIEMTREQAAEIYERLLEEIALDTEKARMDLEPRAILEAIAYTEQLAALFEAAMDAENPLPLMMSMNPEERMHQHRPDASLAEPGPGILEDTRIREARMGEY